MSLLIHNHLSTLFEPRFAAPSFQWRHLTSGVLSEASDSGYCKFDSDFGKIRTTSSARSRSRPE